MIDFDWHILISHLFICLPSAWQWRYVNCRQSEASDCMEVNECLWCDLIQLRTSHHGRSEAKILMLLILIYLFIFHFELQ